MEKFDVVVVGGGPAGFNAVKAVRALYPEKSVLLLNDRADLQIPCSIPYVVSGLLKPEENRYPLQGVSKLGAELKVERVSSVNLSDNSLFTEKGRIYAFDRLVLATGWVPRRLQVEGSDLEGIYYIDTEAEKVVKLAEEIKRAGSLAIIGGGFIGIGFADLIARHLKKRVVLVEASERLASGVFSGRFEERMVDSLKGAGVEVLKGARVSAFEGEGRVRKVLFEDGSSVDADLVLVFVGFLPNTRLAVDAGIETERGFIKVDRFLRTSVDSVLAAGNCVLHYSAVDGSPWPGMLASVSARDGRIAGSNVSGPLIEDPGLVPAGVTEVGREFYGFAGYTEKLLSAKDFDFLPVSVKSADGYPSAIGAKPLELQLFFLKGSGRLVGAEAVGSSKFVAPLVDLLSRLVVDGVDARQLLSLNSVAFPPTTPPPLLQPVQEAALEFLKS